MRDDARITWRKDAALWLLCWLCLSTVIGCGDADSAVIGASADAQVAEADTGALSDTNDTDTENTDTENTDTENTDTDTTDTSGDASGGVDSADGQTSPTCPGEAGCPCASNAECDNGVCLDTPDGKRCAKTCVEDCPKGFTCGKLGQRDASFICIPDHLTTCAPCLSNAECQVQVAGSLCLSYGDAGSFCGGPCEVDDDCPSNLYACVDVLNPGTGKAVKQCKVKSTSAGGSGQACGGDGQCPAGETCEQGACGMWTPGTCPCSVWAQNAAKGTSCAVSNALGSCAGKRACGPNGLSACDASPAQQESCDGIDNDCDGQTDEIEASSCEVKAWLPIGSQATCTDDGDCVIPGESCALKAGACRVEIGACPGTPTCNGGEVVCNAAQTPTVETCNGVDDDCDGKTDDAACDDGDSCTEDVCAGGVCTNTAAINCDDNNPCTNDSCSAGACVYTNSDGSCDDGDACTAGDKCTLGADGKTTCQAGADAVDCDDQNPCTDDSCSPTTGCVQTPNAATQSCYDGPAGTAGVGACAAGVAYCKGGQLQGCTGAKEPALVEGCDGVDDDCDGQTDEGCKVTGATLSFNAAGGQASLGTKGAALELGGTAPIGQASGKKWSVTAGFIGWWRAQWK